MKEWGTRAVSERPMTYSEPPKERLNNTTGKAIRNEKRGSSTRNVGTPRESPLGHHSLGSGYPFAPPREVMESSGGAKPAHLTLEGPHGMVGGNSHEKVDKPTCKLNILGLFAAIEGERPSLVGA